MLRAVPKRWFSFAYNVLENNNTVAVVKPSSFREAAELTIQNTTYRLYRESLMKGTYNLESGSSILARPSTA